MHGETVKKTGKHGILYIRMVQWFTSDRATHAGHWLVTAEP